MKDALNNILDNIGVVLLTFIGVLIFILIYISNEISPSIPSYHKKLYNILMINNNGYVVQRYDSVEIILVKEEFIEFVSKEGVNITSNYTYIVEGYE
jgi:hypothetical protein